MKSNLKNSQSGFITLDFIFASVIFFVFTSILFSFAMTFSIVEVVQYISFSTARSYSLGDVNEDIQLANAQDKYDSLITNQTMRPLLNNGWFEVGNVRIDDFNAEFDVQDDANTFVGAIIPLNAPILYKRVPLLGSTASDPDGFLANVQSFLAIEPSQESCINFARDRFQLIQNEYTSADISGYFTQTDNGC